MTVSAATRCVDHVTVAEVLKEAWKAKADPIEFAKSHKEFARAFESFPGDADKLYPGWRQKLGSHK